MSYDWSVARRRTLIVVLALALLVLAGVAVVLAPILTHQSAGGSGQQVPEGFVSTTTAQGEDGRTRELSVLTAGGEPAELARLHPGDELVVRGSGFDSSIGIYVAICQVPSEPGQKPAPCLGGLPEGATDGESAGVVGSSAWITDDWAWRAFATQSYDDSQQGSFELTLIVPEAGQEGLDCTTSRCAITTRADHTASSDRVQDMQLPVAFA